MIEILATPDEITSAMEVRMSGYADAAFVKFEIASFTRRLNRIGHDGKVICTLDELSAMLAEDTKAFRSPSYREHVSRTFIEHAAWLSEYLRGTAPYLE